MRGLRRMGTAQNMVSFEPEETNAAASAVQLDCSMRNSKIQVMNLLQFELTRYEP